MNTNKYRQITELIFRNNGSTKNVFALAMDIGYSGVKVFAPYVVARFPSYARRISNEFDFVSGLNDNAMIYTDNVTGERWLVGEAAQAQINMKDTTDSESALYGRERYGMPMFSVLARCGLAMGMIDKDYKNAFNPQEKTLVVQTGLPEKYLSMDKDLLVEILSGKHSFTLQIGKHVIDFDFTLHEENVYVMSQPKGTLFSVCIGRDGNWHADAKKYMTSSVLVFDPGFGTLDIFPIRAGAVDGNGETFTNLGMKRVMQETLNKIKETSGVEISVPAFQKYLETGEYKYTDRRKLVSKSVPFDNLLKEASEQVCNEAIETMLSIFDIAEDYDYLIITGGTGAAWLNMIKEKFAGLETLKIIEGNQNDTLPFVFSNVRGYYLYRFSQLLKIHGRE